MPISNYGITYYAGVLIGVNPIPDMWLAICTALPEVTDTGSTIAEAAGSGYGRVLLDTDAYSVPASGSTLYEGALVYAIPTGVQWGLMNSYAVCDAATAGNVLFYGSLPFSVNPIGVAEIVITGPDIAVVN